jgi:MFS transporter, CP family, cyanate transporter
MPRESRAGPPLVLIGLFVASLGLRPQLVGVGPLLSTIQSDLAISHAVAGLLSTVIVLCMGVFALPAVLIARHAGQRWTIAGGLALIAVFGLARALAGPAVAVILLTVPVGIGTAICGGVMPLVVRSSWSRRPVLATALYTTGISLGAAVSAAIAVPLANDLGSWRDPLIVFSLCTGALAFAWAFLSRGSGGRAAVTAPLPRLPRLPWRSRAGWLVLIIFALVEIAYYGLNAWLPSSFTERGWSPESAGALLTVINAVTIPVSFALALRGDFLGSRRFWVTVGGLLQLVGLLGVILAPAGGWLWAVAIGIANGVLFPSMMLMPLDVADHPEDVGAMVAMMFGGGYTLAALGPVLFGVLRDQTGSFTLAMWAIFAITSVAVMVALLSSNPGLRRRPRSRLVTET